MNKIESKTIEVIRGDDVIVFATFMDKDKNVIDITDSTVFLTVKKRLTDEDEDALIKTDTSQHTEPALGMTEIHLSDENTDIAPGEYFYDLQIKTADDKINSVRYGRFVVVTDITRRTEADQ